MIAVCIRNSALAALVVVATACESAGPVSPAIDTSGLAFSRVSASGTYQLTLTCRKDAEAASNVGLDVFAGGTRLFGDAFFCGQSITVGPGATRFHYNLNVYQSSTYLFSCESAGVVSLVPGHYRCAVRDAEFVAEEQKGIWATLVIKKL
jgi:hypothetical protein